MKKGKAVIINHKGEICFLHYTLLCQEGYCKECEIYKKWLINPDGKK